MKKLLIATAILMSGFWQTATTKKSKRRRRMDVQAGLCENDSENIPRSLQTWRKSPGMPNRRSSQFAITDGQMRIIIGRQDRGYVEAGDVNGRSQRLPTGEYWENGI